jgi:hypothetical protein
MDINSVDLQNLHEVKACTDINDFYKSAKEMLFCLIQFNEH